MKPYDSFKIWREGHGGNAVFEYENHFFEGSQTMATLIECMSLADSEEDGIDRFCEINKNAVSREAAVCALENMVKGISSIRTKADDTFIWSKELIPSGIVGNISKHLGCMFDRKVMWLVIACTVFSDISYMLLTPSPFLFNSYVSGIGVAFFLMMVVISSFIHEFGHAAACSRFGIQSGGIGIGLYINFPVLYTDVTKIWRLPVRQRCIVNLGGIYFQSLFLIACITANFFYESDYFKYMILALNLGIILTLNPFFKFDGYWIASDLLGVGNLRQKTKTWLLSLFNKNRGNPMAYQKKKKNIFLLYAVLSNLFFLFFFVYVVPNFLISFIKNYPSELKLLIQYVNGRVMPPFALVRDIMSQTIFMAFLIYWSYGIIRRQIAVSSMFKNKN